MKRRRRIDARLSGGAVIQRYPKPAYRSNARRGAELRAQTRDVLLDRVRRELVLPARDRAHEPVFRHESPRVQREAFEDRPFALRQLERLAVGARFLVRDVERELAERYGRARDGVRAPDQRAAACDQLGHLERLGHVVVGAEVERSDSIGETVASGEHQHGQDLAAIAQALEQAQAVLAGEADVEDQQVERLRLQSRARVLGAADEIGSEARGFERHAHRVAEQRVVFHYQNAHDLILPRLSPIRWRRTRRQMI